MKLLIALSLLVTSDAAWSCLPINMHPTAVAAREEAFRQQVRDATDIVYGVVEQDLRSDAKRPGQMRILHVYKGGFAIGQRLRMRYLPPPGDCVVYRPPGHVDYQRRGTFGVTLITRRQGMDSVAFTGFLHASSVEWMIGEGLIQSARPERVQSKYPAPAPLAPHEQPTPGS